jgi:hypothetical protein
VRLFLAADAQIFWRLAQLFLLKDCSVAVVLLLCA